MENEEVIIKTRKNLNYKVQISSLKNTWKDLDILSIHKEGRKFGSPLFTKIKGFSILKPSDSIKIQLKDGRQIICHSNQIIPKIVPNITRKRQKSLKNMWQLKLVNAFELKKNDNLLVLHKIPFSLNAPAYIFIPRFLNWENKWIGLPRTEYIKFAYKTNQKVNNYLIQLINNKFYYSKTGKIYRILWSTLSETEKDLLEKYAMNGYKILIKIHEKVGQWFSSFIQLTPDFFRYLGWYVSEGSYDKNRISISQSNSLHREYWNEIIEILNRLNFPNSNDGKRVIRINSNIISKLTVKLCSKLSYNKKIPFEFFNLIRANSFLETYFKGDGNLEKGKRKYTTNSRQLKNDLICLIGATGHFCSVWHPSSSDNTYRIIETLGKKYKRKYIGLVKFNSTIPVEIKSIEKIKSIKKFFNLQTENGWYISTNGIILHDSLQ